MDVHACAQAGFKVGANLEEVYLKLGVSLAICNGILKEIKGEWRGHVTSVLLIFPSSIPRGLSAFKLNIGYSKHFN